jgi:TrmH family RNA methyltransferase
MPSDAPFRRLSSRQNPTVSRLRALARNGDAEAALVEGATLAGEAAAAGLTLELVAVTESALAVASTRRLVDRLPASTDRVLVPPMVMDAMSPVRTPSGLVAIARLPSSVPAWGTRPGAGTAFGGTTDRRPDADLVVCAVDVQDPGNLGAIIRVAEAAGATALAAAGRSADPFGWKALRGSMGSAFRLPIVRRTSADETVARARAAGCQVVATVLDGTPFHEVDLSRPTCLLLGSEGRGLPRAVSDAADSRLAIPMRAPVESLNVAVAAGVVLYEARRQRSAMRGPGG